MSAKVQQKMQMRKSFYIKIAIYAPKHKWREKVKV